MPLRTAPLPRSETKKVPKVDAKPAGSSAENSLPRAPEEQAALAPSLIQRQIRAFLEAQANKKAATEQADHDAKARAKAEAFRQALALPPS